MEVLPVSTHIQHNPSLDVVSIIQVNHHQLCIVVVHWRLQLTLSRFFPLFSVVTTSATSTLCHFHDHLGQGQPASLSPASALSKFMSSLSFSQLNQGFLWRTICYNRSDTAVMDFVDTYYSDHHAYSLSLPLCASKLLNIMYLKLKSHYNNYKPIYLQKHNKLSLQSCTSSSR